MAESEQEKGYEVVDKRRVKLGEDGQVSAEEETSPRGEAPAEEGTPQAEAGKEKPGEEEFALPPVDVYSLIESFIGLLGAHAWQWMGLVKNPTTGQVEKDLAQAKVAIDTVSALVGQLEGKIDPAQARDLRGILSDLQVNCVRQSAGM